MASIRFEGIGKTFGDGSVPALSKVDLAVDDGEFLVLVGPSGCGKSTLLRIAAGLEQPTAGAVHLGGKDVTWLDPKHRDIAMVFQNYALYPHMSVYDNMAFGLEQRRIGKSQIRQKVEQAARILDLGALLKRKPGELSGGQQQRVAMGRAIVRDPAAFLMDEPLSNLDAKLRVKMRAELKLLRARLNVTTLYVTHDQVEAMTMGDRVAVMKPVTSGDECNLQQLDKPQQLYERPANLFVASFIGSPAMNFAEARLVTHNGELSLRLLQSDITLTLPAELVEACSLASSRQQSVVVGIRPEDFCRVDLTSTSAFSAPILVSESLGADAYVHFDVPTPRVHIPGLPPGLADADPTAGDGAHSRMSARVDARDLTDAPTVMHFTIDCNRLHLFNASTGNTLRKHTG